LPARRWVGGGVHDSAEVVVVEKTVERKKEE
jgi:hypothetical protein